MATYKVRIEEVLVHEFIVEAPNIEHIEAEDVDVFADLCSDRSVVDVIDRTITDIEPTTSSLPPQLVVTRPSCPRCEAILNSYEVEAGSCDTCWARKVQGDTGVQGDTPARGAA